MNGPNRHMRYRRSVYRRRRLRIALILSIVLLVVLFVAFLIFGNLLNRENEERDESESTDTDAVTESERTPTGAVKAYPVLLETAGSGTFATRLNSLLTKGASVASVPLNGADGTLLYRSPVAMELGLQTAGERSVSLETAMKSAEDAELYVSGVFYLTAFAEPDDLLRSVKLSQSAAILTEAFRAGIDDILLIAPELSAEQTEELLRFANGIRALEPNAVLGLTLSDSILGSEKSGLLIDSLYDGMDFLALNGTNYGEKDPVEHIEATINDPGMLFYLLRYRMRILLPQGADDETQATYIDAAERNGMDNWQILPA